MVMFADLSLPVVTGAAAIDSINPCAIGVLVLLCGFLLRMKDKRKMLLVGSIYIIAVYVTYLLAGLGLLATMRSIGLSPLAYTLIGTVVIIFGLLEVKDFFWYGKGPTLAIPYWASEKIKHYAARLSLPGAVLLGVFAAMVELPCTGAVYMAILTLMAQATTFMTAFFYLVYYNLIFVLPLIIILALAYYGTKVAKLKRWKEANKAWMRLAMGLLLIGMGLWILSVHF